MSQSNPISPTKRVAIFRLQLFKPSETFIPAQVSAFKRWEGVFTGLSSFGPTPTDALVRQAKSTILDRACMALLGSSGPFEVALADLRIDLVHAHFAVDAIYAVPLARRLGVPLITTLHGFDVTTRSRDMLLSGKPALINAALRRRSLQRAGDMFVCVSDFIRQQALATGYPEKKTITLPVGIHLSRLVPATDHDPHLIVHVARLVEKKGTIHLLRAMTALPPWTKLAVIGGGPLEASLRDQAASLGIGKRVQFLGVQSHADTLNLMKRAALVAVPSITARNGDAEGLPTVIFEAGALGIPVVASHTSGIPEAVDSGVTGLLVKERDEAGLAYAMNKVLNDMEKRTSLGREARLLMERRFDLSRQTAVLESFYDQLLQPNPMRETPEAT